MWNHSDSPNEASKIIAELRKYSGRYFDLSASEKEEIAKLTKKLDDLQRLCGHTWTEYTLMNGVYRECRYCAKSERIR